MRTLKLSVRVVVYLYVVQEEAGTEKGRLDGWMEEWMDGNREERSVFACRL